MNEYIVELMLAGRLAAALPRGQLDSLLYGYR